MLRSAIIHGDLVSRISNGISVVVTAPRRFGKTSLIDRAAEMIRSADGAIVSINLLHCSSLDAFAGRLVAGAYAAHGGRARRTAQALPEFLRRIRLRPTLTIEPDGGPQFSFGGLAGRDAISVLDDVYGIVAAASAERPVALILDEFQAVGDLGGDIAPALKALGDQHPRVSLVLAGSRHHLMDALALSRGAPLYHMVEPLALGPIDERVMARFLVSRARHGGKQMSGDAARRICQLAGPTPYDIQRLAYEIFGQAGERIDAASVDAGIGAVVRREDPNCADRFAGKSIGHRRVLAAIAVQGPVARPYAAQFARDTGYAGPPGVRRAIEALTFDETVTETPDGLKVTDPFFAEWLRQL